jgi:hypothetical protein
VRHGLLLVVVEIGKQLFGPLQHSSCTCAAREGKHANGGL